MKISVITINYNNLAGLEETFSSVVNQSYSDKEYILIDGGSTDGSKEFIEANADKLTYWVSEKDNGLYNAMNKGIQKSIGDYLIFMNSGDMFFNGDVLSEVFIKEHTSDILCGSTIYKYSQGGILRKPRPLGVMEHELPFCHQSCFIKGSLMRDCLYDESYKFIADYAFFYRCYREGKSFEVVPKIVSIYDTTGVSADPKRAWQIYKERCRVLNICPSTMAYRMQQTKRSMKKGLKLLMPSKLVDYAKCRPAGSNDMHPIETFQQL